MTETVAPPETAAVKPPTVDAAEAARLRQERIAALQAAVDQFLAEAGRGDATGAAGGTPGTVAEPSWARHAREFDACDAASARAEALAEEARILSGPTGSEPAVESLQEKIEAASCRALAQAASAAQATLAGFAQACNTAIVHGDLEGAGVSSYAELAQHCRDRQMQWETASLRLHMPELGLRMELYGAYEAACARMRGDPGRTADALNNTARQLNDTARMVQRISRGAPADLAATLGTFHKFCQHKRNDLLREVSRMQVDAIARIRADAAEALNPVLPRSLAVSAAYDVLLLGNRVGDPLPDDLDGTPDVPSGSASTDPASTDSPQLPTASSDLSLAEMALKVAESARDQHKGVVELPANAPERAAHELQAGLAMLRQTELTAQTAAATIGRFHELSSGLENARPNDRRAIAKRHLDAVRQLAAELRQALQVLDGVTTRSLAPDVHDRLTQSKARLRADQRLAARVEVSLKTLDSLLTWREVADGVRQGIKQGRETNVANDTVAGVRHGNAIKELNGESSMLTRQLPDEPDPVEAESLETHKSGLELLIKCDKELTLGKILLEWGTKVLQHKGRPPNPQGFMSLKHLVAGQPGRLVANNMSLLARSTSSEHAGRYEAQLEINNRTIRGLRELKEKLDNKATPGAAAGSSNSQASVARLLGIPAKGKPSRHSQPRRR